MVLEGDVINVKNRIFAVMKRLNQIFSLVLALLMMGAAAITVNKSLFGKDFQKVDNSVGAETAVSADNAVERLDNNTTIIHTAQLPGVINGYAGPVPLDITVSDGIVSKIEALPNVETPSFFKRVTPLLDAWTGLPVAEAKELKVDAVSGATYSSNAVISNVNAGLDYYLGINEQPSRQPMPLKLWVALAVTLIACILPLFVKNKWYNLAQMIANIAVLGFWCGQFLDYTVMLRSLAHGFAFPAALVVVVMLVAAFIYPLFGKHQYYCTHVCPLGSAQQLVAQICNYKIHISARTLKALDWFRKILWAGLMLLLWADCLTGWVDLELFQAFQFKSASWWIIGAALIFIVFSAIINRPYCRFVCPTGSLFKRAENIG